MLRDLHAVASTGSAVTLKDRLFVVSLNVISRMVLGKKYDVAGSSSAATPEEFSWMIDELFFISAAVNIGDVIPWLNWLDPQGYVGRMKRLSKVLDEHNERRRREGEAFVPKTWWTSFCSLPTTQTSRYCNKRAIRGGYRHLGSNRGVGHVRALRNPQVLVKATEELDRVIGRDRLVTEGDIQSLPYLEAIVKETMRLHPVSPLLMPRQSRLDTSVGGYDIPAGTRVLVNVWAIGREPEVWETPMEFRPERFLGSSLDVRGRDFELLPFGSGRRMCPGLNLGMKMVQLSLSNLLHAFAWRRPNGVSVEDVSMEEKNGLSVTRRLASPRGRR
ncbi:hypothetical protein EJB05_06527, partial [Eragrostis curvula]